MTLDSPRTHPNRLEIHVIGTGTGESIVLRLPNGEWGVVDCCAPSLTDLSRNPVLRFLKKKDVKKLAFLCLTHPHADHFIGMDHLLDTLEVVEFWRFPVNHGNLNALLRRLELEAKEGCEDPNPLRKNATLQLATMLCKVHERKQEKTLRVRRCGKSLWPWKQYAGVYLYVIAPSDDIFDKYCSLLDFGKLDHPRHNDISLALYLRFGTSGILLGGDVEVNNWEQVMREDNEDEGAWPPNEFRLKIDPTHVIKVSHHGSPNGIEHKLWERMTSQSTKTAPYAIIAPAERHGLPTKEGIDKIKKYTSNILVTNMNAKSLQERFAFSPKVPVRDQQTIRKAGNRDIRGISPLGSTVGICSVIIDDGGDSEVEFDGDAGRLE